MEKHIGIMTFHKAMNYGAVLQAYALQRFLSERYGAADVIDYLPGRHLQNTALFVAPTGRARLRRDALSALSLRYQKRRRACFQEFLDENLRLGEARNVKHDALDDALRGYDAVVCGSDQIWNPRLAEADAGFFLPGDGGYRRIAYAASLGKGRLGEYAQPYRVREALRRFDAVSVRERASRQKLERFARLPVEIGIMPDPTLLVDREELLRVAGPRQTQQPYIFLYSIRGRKDTLAAAGRLSRRTGIACRTLLPGIPKPGWLRQLGQVPDGDVGPAGFLALIRDADYVVTDSFHCAVISMRLRKRLFIIAEQRKDGSIIRDERIGDLCDDFGLGQCLTIAERIDEAPLEPAMDWERMEALRLEKVQAAERFFADALKEQWEPVGDEIARAFDPADENAICPTDLCTACQACVNRCPKGAISMRDADDGRRLPVIDPALCVRCRACVKVCPRENPPVFHLPRACYAAQRTDTAIRRQSSSGGISALLAEHVIAAGGCAFGAAIDGDLAVRHICADTLAEAERLRTSKYAMSDIGDSYRQAREQLERGRRVLFTGTPCQLAGLRNYLGKDYGNLICAEVLCHGAPPMAYLKQYLRKKMPDADSYAMRGGDRDKRMRLMKGKETLYEQPWWKDAYYFAFLTDMALSEGCYSCAFARPERAADLTLCDFWKLDKSTLSTPMTDRISAVLVNTERGEEAWREIAGDVVWEARSLEDVKPGNPNLSHPSQASGARTSFLDQYRATGDFNAAFRTSRAARAFTIQRLKKSPAWRALRKAKRLLTRG